MKNPLLHLKPVAKAYLALQIETSDYRPVAYRFKLEWLRVRVIHVPSGQFKLVPLL